MKGNWNIKKFKKYDIIFKMTILGLKSSFLFIIFTNPYLIIGVNKIQLLNPLYLVKSIKKFSNK